MSIEQVMHNPVVGSIGWREANGELWAKGQGSMGKALNERTIHRILSDTRIRLALAVAGGLGLLYGIVQLPGGTIGPFDSVLDRAAAEWYKDHPPVPKPEIPAEKPETAAAPEDQYSGWNTFEGKGFTLKYPKESGWEKYPHGIFFAKPNESIEDVGIEPWVESIGRRSGSFQGYVSEQYKALSPKAVASQPAKLPKWEQARLQAEVLTYESRPGPSLPTYDTRRFMAYINGMVYNILVREEISKIVQYDPVVEQILNSLAIAGVPKS